MRQTKSGVASLVAASSTMLLQADLALGQIVPIDLSKQNCGVDSFFNTAVYACEKCGTNAERLDDFNCQCKLGHVRTQATRYSFDFECEKCDSGSFLAPNHKQTACSRCDLNDPNMLELSTEGQCICKEGYRAVEVDKLGFPITDSGGEPMIKCEACPANQYLGSLTTTVWDCVACPDKNMVYDARQQCSCPPGYITAGDGCITQAEYNELFTLGFIASNGDEHRVQYNNVHQLGREEVTTVLADSDVFSQFYYQSAVGCKYDKNQKQCQILANLCVFQLYNEWSQACQLFKSLTKEQALLSQQEPFYDDQGWKKDLPWLYYQQTPNQVFQEGDPVDLTVTFDNPSSDGSRVNKLKFWLAQYSLEGEFLSMQVIDNELSPCFIDMKEVEDMVTFGVVSQISCKINLVNLAKNEEQNLPLTANFFFELFLEDANKKLVDVPVLVKNLRDSEGKSPNAGYSGENSRLTHRFFLFDTISGIKSKNGYKEKKQPAYVRYAHSVRLTVQMDPSQQETIRKPLLEIDYREYQTSIVEPSDEVPAHFYFEYYETAAKFETDAEITVMVFNGVSLLIVAIRMFYWVKLNPPRFMARHFGMAFARKLLFFLCDVWSNIMFMVYFVLTMYWFIMYKMQANAHLLMPQRNKDNSTYDLFFGFLITIIVTKLVAVFLTVIEQTSADIFVMDWERYEQMKLVEVVDKSSDKNAPAQPAASAQATGAQASAPGAQDPAAAAAAPAGAAIQKTRMEPSGEDVGSIAWRSLFIVNELNELAVDMRKVAPETTLIWFIFFYLTLGWQWIGQQNPTFKEVEERLQPFNEFLVFFLSTFIYLCVVIVQVIIRFILTTTDDPPSLNFADLCVLSNCSVLIMTEKYHGYYIHGKAPWAKSDLPLAWLKLELDMEAENKRKPRALGTEASNLNNVTKQLNDLANTYEIFVQPNFRQNFDAWRDTPLEQMDNRNLSEKERQQLEETKRLTMVKRKSTKNAAVIQEDEADELNDQGLSPKEVHIVRQERKKRIINHMLCQTFNLIDERKLNNITQKSFWERLVQSSPTNFQFNVDDTKVPFHLVPDQSPNFPAFERNLYCHLDYDMLILIICFINVFAQKLNNPVLAICLSYLIERGFRWLHGFLGEKNLVKKTIVDDCFLL